MECGKCKFQFCWWCLSDFYTNYHFYESMCPLRIIPIYTMLVMLAGIIQLKMLYTLPLVLELER